MKTPAPAEPACESEETGLPWLRSWNGVYLFVLASFVVWVGLLVLLTGWYS